MNAVGIDVSKGKSMVCVLRPFGELVVNPYTVGHTASELESLARSLKSLDGETRVVMEHTGRYYEPVAQALHEAGLYVSAVNPQLIKKYGNNSLRRVKTDKADAMKIARYAIDNWVELREYIPMETARENLKLVCRQYNLYVKLRTQLKNNLIALLDKTFPGVNTFFSSPARSDGSQKWVDFAASFWHCECVCGLSENAFTERYAKWCKQHCYNFSLDKALEIHAASCGHIALLPKNENAKVLIKGAITQLNAISQTVETFRLEMHRLAKILPEYPVVAAMYGVSDTTAAQLMAEIGDVRRFTHKGSLTAFAGVDPGARQSGDYEQKSNRVSKSGCPELRKILYQIAVTHIRTKPQDEPVYQFLDRKRAEGKPYFVYMTAAANKFLRIYYGRLKEYLNALDEGDNT